jgi:hypothetical protein
VESVTAALKAAKKERDSFSRRRCAGGGNYVDERGLFMGYDSFRLNGELSYYDKKVHDTQRELRHILPAAPTPSEMGWGLFGGDGGAITVHLGGLSDGEKHQVFDKFGGGTPEKDALLWREFEAAFDESEPKAAPEETAAFKMKMYRLFMEDFNGDVYRDEFVNNFDHPGMLMKNRLVAAAKSSIPDLLHIALREMDRLKSYEKEVVDPRMTRGLLIYVDALWSLLSTRKHDLKK